MAQNKVKKAAKKALKKTILVKPSDNIFSEVGHNNYTDVDIISELIDNALANRVKGKRLHIVIEVGVSEKSPNKSFFVIRDDASGIPEDDLGDAISPGATANAEGRLSEHGLGMKQAIAAGGKLEYLLTKASDAETATLVRRFGYGEIEAESVPVPWEHGTEIRISHLKEILRKNVGQSRKGGRQYNERIRSYLGARYRRFLRPDDKQIDILIRWQDLDSGEKREIPISSIRPIYFHPSTRDNKPVVLGKAFQGKGWSAKLTFGYAPTEKEEYQELGVPLPKEYEPYSVSLKHQGLDIIRSDRVIMFHQLASIGLVRVTHNKFNIIRGEIDLIDGFQTAATKNRVVEDDHFEELIEKISSYLDQENLLDRKRVPGDVPEQILRDRLKTHLETRKQHRKSKVVKEYVIQGLEGYIDLLCDDEEAWELKVGQAGGLDVYQLFGYMDMGGFKRGYLLAEGFSTGATEAANFITKKYGLSIECVPTSDFPITHPITRQELDAYDF